jgi:hypothetical protein
MHYTLLAFLALPILGCLPQSVYSQEPSASPRSRYESLLKEFAKAQAEYAKRLEDAASATAANSLTAPSNNWSRRRRRRRAKKSERHMHAL